MTAGRLRVAAALLLLLSLVGVTAPSVAAQSDDLPLTLTVTALSPTAPQPGDLLTVSGSLTNPTAEDFGYLTIQLRLATTPLLSRSDLLAVVGDTGHVASAPVGKPAVIGYLAPGAVVNYRLQVPVDSFGLTTPGVYRLSVEVTTDPDDPVAQARVNTFLPWVPPSAEVPPLDVAWVWPLLSTPHLEPDDSFSDDSLAAEVSPRGRLGLLLGVAAQAAAQSGTVPGHPAHAVAGVVDPTRTSVPIRPVPVTPVIDPETIQELRLMADTSKPYAVEVAGTDRTTPGTGAAAASAYLSDLQQLMARTSSIAVPYADPDLEALAHAGESSLVTQARSTGIEAGLPNIVSGLVWPPSGTLSEGALNQLTTSALLLDASALPVTSAPDYTPGATTAVSRPGGTVPAVVIDAGLSTLVTKQVGVANRVLLAQRYAAETAAIALEPGPAPRTLVIAPARRWSPKESSVRSLLDETGRLPWLDPIALPTALAQPVDLSVTRGPLQQPSDQPALAAGTPDQIKTVNAALAGFRSILCPPAARSGSGTSTPQPTSPTSVVCTAADPVLAQVLELQRSIYRAASSAFQVPDDAAGAALLRSTSTAISTLEDQVSIATKGDLNLVGHQARVPITIVNKLSVPVEIKVVLHSTSRALKTGAAETVRIPAGGNPQIDLTVRTERAGAFTLPVEAQLLTPGGQPFGSPAQLRVRVSALGEVIVWITVVVCGLLGLAVVVRIYRRIRNARRGISSARPTEPAAS